MGFLDLLFGKHSSKSNSKVTVVSDGIVHVNKPTIPPFQGDYAQAYFLDLYKKSTPIKKPDQYQQYLKYTFGITDACSFHKKMIEEGFLELSSVEECLLAMKVSELKEILSCAGLSTTGKKSDLIKRIVENDSIKSSVSENITEQYCISKKGEQYLSQHADLIDLYKNRGKYNISYDEYISMKQRIPNSSYHDILWSIFNERISKDHYDLGCSQYHSMYYLLIEEKRYVDALSLLLIYFSLDINNNHEIKRYIETYENVFNTLYSSKKYLSEFDIPTIHILIDKDIESLKEYYKPEMIEKCFFGGPFEICNKADFENIIVNIINSSYDKESIEEQLNSAIKTFIEKEIKKRHK